MGFGKVSSTGPENLLPQFFFMAGGEEGGDFSATGGYTGGLGEPSPFTPPGDVTLCIPNFVRTRDLRWFRVLPPDVFAS